MPRPALRAYQQDAVAAVIKSLETNPSTLLVMATGLGKTQVAASVAEHYLPGKVLFLAHRKELVHQGCDRLELVTGYPAEIEMAELRASTNIPIVCASLDSITNRLEKWKPDHFALLIFDECFPAGTLVDGRPIERIATGDIVSSVDHSTGMVIPRTVVRTFKKLCSSMWRLCYGDTKLTCTGNHPVFVKGRGYVEANRLVPGDLLCVRLRMGVHGSNFVAGQEDMLPRVSSESLVGDYGAHQHHPLLRAHEAQQPDAPWGQQRTGHGYSSSYGSQASNPWRERTWGYFSGEGLGGRAWVANKRSSLYEHAARERLSYLLQNRRGEPGAEGGDRGGWAESRGAIQTSAGSKEGEFLAWVRLDSSSSVEPASPGGDFVYNLEIEGSHTYFANDALVHNCHHSLAPSYKKVLDHFTCPKMGMTATPDRGDEKALGKVWQDVAGVWDIVDGIEQGYLVPIRGRSVRVEEINLSGISKTAGDLAVGELDAEMVKHIEGIVSKTLELEPGRQGIWFFPGVKSAELACDRINALLPNSCAFVYAETPKEERDDLMRGFKSGRYSHLTNVGIATEGFDAPNADMVVIGRPTLSRALFAQMVGRGLRVLPGVVDSVVGSDGGSARRGLIAGSNKRDCVVIDFAGNSGKHSLITPEDLLGGDYSDEEVKLAKEQAKNEVGADVLANLAAARRELKAMMAKIQSRVKATVQEFNPFSVLNMQDPDPHKERFREPMTPGQVTKLKGYNLKDKQMAGLSKLEAQKLIGSLEVRRNLGLCSLNQLHVLKRYCDAPVNLTFRKASQAMNYLAESNWNPDRSVLQGMVAKR